MAKAGQLSFIVGEVLAVPRDYSWLASDRPLFQCQGQVKIIAGPLGEVVERRPCGRLLPDFCFRPKPRRVDHLKTVHWRPVHWRCVSCEQEDGEAYRELWIHEVRARKALQRHMRIERKEGLHGAWKLSEYEALSGVTVAWLADKMRVAEQNDSPCPHCEVRWSEMPGGWRLQMTVDRPDVSRTLAQDNCTLKCRTGNSQGARTPVRTRQVREAYWRVIRRERRGEHG